MRDETAGPEDSTGISRDNFESTWLGEKAGTVSPDGFDQVFYEEHPEAREVIKPHLGEAVKDHHFHRARISRMLAMLGHNQAARFFREELPKSNTTRKGNFGEVVASEHLIQRHGLHMPVFKIRYRDSHNLPMRGEDIIAFGLDCEGRIERVVIGEAKCVVKFRANTVREAHARLASAFSPRPMTLSMIAEIMYDRGNHDFGAEIDRVSLALAKGDFAREHWIFLINQVQTKRAFAAIEKLDEVVPNLHCIGFELSELTALVDEMFDKAGCARSSEDAS